MAKGKKSTGHSYISKGQHSNVKQSTLRDMRAESNALGARVRNQQAAFIKGKKVMVTIANPNAAEKDKPFIRVNAKEVWNNSRFEKYVMGGIR